MRLLARSKCTDEPFFERVEQTRPYESRVERVIAIAPIMARHARVFESGSETPHQLAWIAQIFDDAVCINKEQAHVSRDHCRELGMRLCPGRPVPVGGRDQRSRFLAATAARELAPNERHPFPRPPEQARDPRELEPRALECHAVEQHHPGDARIIDGRDPASIGRAADAADHEPRRDTARGEMIQSGLRRRTRIDAGEMRRFARARKIEAERADSARCQTLRDLDVHSEWTGTRNEAGVGQDQYRLIAGASAGQHADEAVVGTETLERLHDQAPSARQACAMSSTTPYSLRDRNIARSMPMPSSKRGA